MHTISKTFSFCYGHRLVGDKGKCRHIHGHTAKATFNIGCQKLDDKGMVIHFDRLKETLGKWIEDNLDHTLLLSDEDPVANILEKQGEKIHRLPFNPTAENIAKLLYETAEKFGLSIVSVEVWESETACATYRK